MGSGYKDFAPGDVLTAADVDGYLMRQTAMTFADASARDTALSGVLDEGMVAYLEDTNRYTFYNGSSWADVVGLGNGSATNVIGTFSAGDVLQAAEMNRLANITVLDTSQTINDAQFTFINFNNVADVVVDVGNWHSTSVNPTRITPTVAGLYRVDLVVQWAGSVVDYSVGIPNKNGTRLYRLQVVSTNIIGEASMTQYVIMNGTTDYLELEVYQESGGTNAGDFQFAVELVRAT